MRQPCDARLYGVPRCAHVQTRISQISAQLELGNLDQEENEAYRSPSPPPVYDTEGQRLNTREVCIAAWTPTCMLSMCPCAVLCCAVKGPSAQWHCDYTPYDLRPWSCLPVCMCVWLAVLRRGSASSWTSRNEKRLVSRSLTLFTRYNPTHHTRYTRIMPGSPPHILTRLLLCMHTTLSQQPLGAMSQRCVHMLCVQPSA